jgi:formylglycine-generating enzyme required for sulfatase activity
VTCVSWVKATEYCRSLGADLPSEAQFEYVAGGLRSQRYPWGNDDPQCGDAVWGREQTPVASCLPPNALGAALPPGSGARDRWGTDAGVVSDMAGNVAEWVRDMWNRVTESCWTPTLFHDPVCETPTVVDAVVVDAGADGEAGASDAEIPDAGGPDVLCPPVDAGPDTGINPSHQSQYVLKAGGWDDDPPNLLRATRRQPINPYHRGPDFGFRCARPGQ